MINVRTSICDELNIQFPVIQAGMAGTATAALAAAVSMAGGLGTVGAAYMAPETIRTCIRDIREKTDKPFGVNLFCTKEQGGTDGFEKVQHVLNRFRKDLGMDEKLTLKCRHSCLKSNFKY